MEGNSYAHRACVGVDKTSRTDPQRDDLRLFIGLWCCSCVNDDVFSRVGTSTNSRERWIGCKLLFVISDDDSVVLRETLRTRGLRRNCRIFSSLDVDRCLKSTGRSNKDDGRAAGEETGSPHPYLARKRRGGVN